MVLPDGGAQVVLARSVVFDKRVVVQTILGFCTRSKDNSHSSDRDEQVTSSVRHIHGVKEKDFSVQNRDARVPAVAPEKHSGQFRELLVSSKETSHVTNVTGTTNSGAEIARETNGV